MIVEAMNVHMGPKSTTDKQWAKCGAGLENVRVIGCIITESFAKNVWDNIPQNDWLERDILAREFSTILAKQIFAERMLGI